MTAHDDAPESLRDTEAFCASKGLPRTRIDEALARWEAKGPTSLTVALAVDALYGARERIAQTHDILDAVEANPTGWGGPPVVSLARSIRAALAGGVAADAPTSSDGGAK
ncbi:hypothetical protein [Knoellia sp. LjRoot47]|uniref:hypothetical protein n=1 Tax=Knoellia sp. LjRoot47 TaxID=3342330 RepID=UPI003ED1247E